MSLLSLNNASNLLAKCIKELHDLEQCEEHPGYDFTLFNIILDLNHLFEWYLKEKNLEIGKKLDCIKQFNPFQSPDDVSRDFKEFYKRLEVFPQTDMHQEVIRKLCNKAKHFKRKPLEKQHKKMTAVCGADHMVCGNEKAECGGFDHYIYSVEINGADKDLKKLISSQIEKWSILLNNKNFTHNNTK